MGTSFYHYLNINLSNLILYLLGILTVGTILFHITHWMKLPEEISTPISGIGALVINFFLVKDFIL